MVAHQAGQLGERARLQNLPLVDNGDAVAEFLRLFQMMGGENDGGSLPGNVADDVEDVVAALGIDPHGRLIEQQGLGLMHQPNGQIQAPLHAAGESRDRFAGAVRQAHAFQQLLCIFLQSGPRYAVQTTPEAKVFPSAELLVQGQVLGNQTQQAFGRPRRLPQIVVLDAHRALVRPQEPRDHADRRGLAGAVGAQQAEQLALRNREGNAVHGLQRAKPLGQVFDGNHGDEDRLVRVKE